MVFPVPLSRTSQLHRIVRHATTDVVHVQPAVFHFLFSSFEADIDDTASQAQQGRLVGRVQSGLERLATLASSNTLQAIPAVVNDIFERGDRYAASFYRRVHGRMFFFLCWCKGCVHVCVCVCVHVCVCVCVCVCACDYAI
jgi:hypothetical protein